MKSVCQVEFHASAASVQLIEVPVFQKLERIKGTWESITRRLSELKTAGAEVWLEIIYEGTEIMGDLRERLDAAVAGSQLEILRVKNKRILDRVLEQSHAEEALNDLNTNEVFQRCLVAHEVPEAQWPELVSTYQEALTAFYENADLNTERQVL